MQVRQLKTCWGANPGSLRHGGGSWAPCVVGAPLRGGGGGLAVVRSGAQRTPAHPALRGHRQKAAPALSDAQNVAEDLWEDLCSTLREL